MSAEATLVGLAIAAVFFALATASVPTGRVNMVGAGLFTLTLTLWLLPVLIKVSG